MVLSAYCVHNLHDFHKPQGVISDQYSNNQVIRSHQHKVFNFSFSDHVSQAIKSTRVHARDLYRICPILDLNTSVVLANALVSSRLDYCNSLFLSHTDFELRTLQLVQKSFCRVLTRSSKYSLITDLELPSTLLLIMIFVKLVH